MSPCVEFPQISLQIFERRLVDKLVSTNQALLVARTVGSAEIVSISLKREALFAYLI